MKMPAKLSNSLICVGALVVAALTALGADNARPFRAPCRRRRDHPHGLRLP